MPADFLLKILAIINLLVSGSRSGTEVAFPLVLEKPWCSDSMRKRTLMQTGSVTSLLFLVRSAREFLGMTQFAGPAPGRTASPKDRFARPLSSARLFITICIVLSLGGCSNDDLIPPFTITFSVAVGDLNGDGRPDIASANTFIAGPPPHPGHVSVILQSQSSPGAFGSAMNLAVGSDPLMVSIGDLNGDNLMDLVAANESSASISILFQNSSSHGTFLTAQNLGVGAHPNGVAIGDLNGDGHLDIAVADSGLSILFQNASDPGTFFSPLSLGVNCSSVGIGDLNVDGRADLVAACANAGNVKLFLQNPAEAGTFLPPQTVAAGFQPKNVAIADLNADGLLDLAIANYGTGNSAGTASVSVLLNSSASPGSFSTATNYATGDNSWSVAVGDLNGDGKADLAVANAGTFSNIAGNVSVFFQNPGTPGAFLPAVNRPGASGPTGVAIADLNGDSLLDIALADEGVRILFQIPGQPGNFQSAILVGS
ncbi:MAG: VCBS repeat-containing protein [Nitrospiraceae bacterium]|nr:VCBS repeat-containing protein [Nitrospiraceae bacterium]